MELSSIYHRPESEFAYLYDQENIHLRLRSKRGDLSKVRVVFQDPFLTEQDETELTLVAQTSIFDFWQVQVTVPYRRLMYYFVLEDSQGQIMAYGDDGFHEMGSDQDINFDSFFRLPYLHESERAKVPEWVKSTVWYQIFPERFKNGRPELSPEQTQPWDAKIRPTSEDFFGGDLEGIIQELDYLADLGIRGLYLCPIFEAPTNHKYDTIDYLSVDPHFGDKETFKRLVQGCHARGIRVMLDAVFNHIGAHSKQWQDVRERGAASPYTDWFHIHKFPVVDPLTPKEVHRAQGLSYEMFAFEGRMPKLNTQNPEVQRYLLDIASYWIREFDIDGWRLDVANEIDHDFWRAFAQQVRSIKPDLYILGEIWHNSQPWLAGDQFDAVMNYLGTTQTTRYFLEHRGSAQKLVDAVLSQQMLYRRQHNEVMFNLLDSHDTWRILSLAKGNKDRVKAALAFNFLQLGSPCLYYGTEYGLDGDHDPGCRKVMPWDPAQQDQDMHAFVKALIALRHRYNDWIIQGQIDYEALDNGVKISLTHQGSRLVAYFNHEGSLKIDQPTKLRLANGYYENCLGPDGLIIYEEEV